MPSKQPRANLDDRDYPQLQRMCLGCRSVSCERGWCQRYEDAARACLKEAPPRRGRGYRRYQLHGRQVTVAEMAAETGLTTHSIYRRLREGYTPEEVMSTPRGGRRALGTSTDGHDATTKKRRKKG